MPPTSYSPYSFKRFNAKRNPVAFSRPKPERVKAYFTEPELDDELPLPKGTALVSKYDVYSPDERLLLIRSGEAVNKAKLSQLIRFGAEPENFTLKTLSEPDTESKTRVNELAPLPQLAWNRVQQEAATTECLALQTQQREQKMGLDNQEAVGQTKARQTTSETLTEPVTLMVLTPYAHEVRQLRSRLAHLKQTHLLKIMQANTVNELFAMLEETQPTHILINFYLGKKAKLKHGLQAAEALRELGVAVPIYLGFALPSSATNEHKEKLRYLAARHQAEVLEKPLSSQQLAPIIKKSLTALPFTGQRF